MKTLALTLLAALALAAPAAAKKADLVVSGTTTNDGVTVTAKVTIKNKGKAKATANTANMSIGSVGYPAQVVATGKVKAIKKGKKRTITMTGQVPGEFKPLTYDVTACADPDQYVEERNENNNCRKVGEVVVQAVSGTANPATPAGPIPFEPDQPVLLESGQSPYWVVVGPTYTGATAVPLFVWMHGCGGDSSGDIYSVAPTDGRNYVAISIGGRDGGCWDMDADPAKVLAAIANVETHFNINQRMVIIGGYSSGGDLAYRTAFFNSTMFAGLLAENTTPFRDTGKTQQESIAAATFKFKVVHLAHTEDDVYPIETVRQETDALTAAGFSMTRVERPGGHSDESTDPDLRKDLLPHIMDGWTTP